MTSAQSLELFILDGEQAGAHAPLQSGGSIDISGDLDTDIVLSDPRMAGQHIRLSVGTESAKLDVLAGDAELLGQRVDAGGSIELPPYVPLKIGTTTLAYGEMNSARWADVRQFGVGSMGDESAQLNMHAEPSTHDRQSRKPSPNAAKKGLLLWLSAAAVGMFGLTLEIGAFSSISAPKTMQQAGAASDVAAVLGDAGFSTLEVVEAGAGRFAIRGYLETREQRARLLRLFAETAGFSQVQIQVLVGEQLAEAVREVYRVNGIPADVRSQGPAVGNRNESSNGSSWYEAMAEAWGQSLDTQASRIEEQSKVIGEGMDNPSAITQLTAESLKMSFMANSSKTSLSSVGSALETMARKQ